MTSVILLLCVLVCGAWLVFTASGRVGDKNPSMTARDFSRALKALDPAAPDRKRALGKRPPPRRGRRPPPARHARSARRSATHPPASGDRVRLP